MANSEDKHREGESLLGRILANYNLSLTLFILFLATWISQFVVEWIHVRNEAEQHGETFQFADFIPSFWQSTLENWQSEFLQLFAFVTLTAFLIHRGSPESKDGDEEMKQKLDEIQQDLRELRRARGS